mgnify:CR=1 FL=1
MLTLTHCRQTNQLVLIAINLIIEGEETRISEAWGK